MNPQTRDDHHCRPDSPPELIKDADDLEVFRALHFGGCITHVGLDYGGTLTSGNDQIDPELGMRPVSAEAATAVRQLVEADVTLALVSNTMPDAGWCSLSHSRRSRSKTSLPAAWITGYGVETGGDHLSDHRPVWAETTFGETGGPTP